MIEKPFESFEEGIEELCGISSSISQSISYGKEMDGAKKDDFRKETILKILEAHIANKPPGSGVEGDISEDVFWYKTSNGVMYGARKIQPACEGGWKWEFFLTRINTGISDPRCHMGEEVPGTSVVTDALREKENWSNLLDCSYHTCCGSTGCSLCEGSGIRVSRNTKEDIIKKIMS